MTPYSTIKLVSREILPALTHIINLSISSRRFPSAWKNVKIIPLHKKEDKLNPKNYRPVAIVPILSKILERVIFNQMIDYFEENCLLNSNHHAYRAHHNTTTALIQMYDGWLESIEAGNIVGACLLDLSAAFDVVEQSLLLSKLKLYGFDDGALSWVQSYLEFRSQCVSAEGCLSKLLPVDTGVPQGSILGPLLYTIFTNELPTILDKNVDSEMCYYADDTTVSCMAKTEKDLTATLTQQFKMVTDFMTDNGLKVNGEKLNSW